jgi:hypothetical protein
MRRAAAIAEPTAQRGETGRYKNIIEVLAVLCIDTRQ